MATTLGTRPPSVITCSWGDELNNISLHARRRRYYNACACACGRERCKNAAAQKQTNVPGPKKTRRRGRPTVGTANRRRQYVKKYNISFVTGVVVATHTPQPLHRDSGCFRVDGARRIGRQKIVFIDGRAKNGIKNRG